jgi:hypothetical protein
VGFLGMVTRFFFRRGSWKEAADQLMADLIYLNFN